MKTEDIAFSTETAIQAVRHSDFAAFFCCISLPIDNSFGCRCGKLEGESGLASVSVAWDGSDATKNGALGRYIFSFSWFGAVWGIDLILEFSGLMANQTLV